MPPEEPAVDLSVSYGFRTTPNAEPIETSGEKAHSAMLAFASTMAPAFLSSWICKDGASHHATLFPQRLSAIQHRIASWQPQLYNTLYFRGSSSPQSVHSDMQVRVCWNRSADLVCVLGWVVVEQPDSPIGGRHTQGLVVVLHQQRHAKELGHRLGAGLDLHTGQPVCQHLEHTHRLVLVPQQ